MEQKHTLVYGLVCPVSGFLRYVGKTAGPPNVRLRKHISTARRGCVSHKAKWIRWVLRRGLLPSMVRIEECAGDGSAEEVFHIALATRDGLKLTNGTEGGDGHELSEETKRKIGAKSRGRRMTEEGRRKMRLAWKNRTIHPNWESGKDCPAGSHRGCKRAEEFHRLHRRKTEQG